MTAITSNGDARTAAVDHWLAAASRGEHLTGKELAERYDRSDGWGRARVREARHRTAEGAAAGEWNDTVTGGTGTATDPDRAATAEGAAVAAPMPAAGGGSPAAMGAVPGWVGAVTVAAVLLVAAAGAVASVEHLAELARLAGVQGWRAWLLPASLDGLVLASSMCVYRAHLLAERAGLLAPSALLAGLLASIIGNILSVYPELAPEAWLKVTVGASAPVALALSFDLALRQTRRIAQPRTAHVEGGTRR